MKCFFLLNINKDIKYPISKNIAHNHLSDSYHSYIAASFSLVVSNTYVEVVKDPRWIDEIQEEIKALESNNTWELTKLPTRKIL